MIYTIWGYNLSDLLARRDRQKAWERHYTVKGCSPEKARTVAYKKCQNKGTWPPR